MKNLSLIFVLLISTFISCSDFDTTINSKNEFKTIVFPDGSKAYLNKNSTVEYNNDFKQRIVSQNGEAFYSVKHNASPFIVKTSTGEIKVLGTEFNVNTTNNKLDVEVEKGAVEVKVNKLVKKVKKGQKALFDDVKKGIKIGKAEFKHKKWRREFKKVKNDLKKGAKKVGKETKKIGNSIKKVFKN
ncbi:FecR family protein [Tenacibaculum insulae]|uniref:FecR family protein n=1 Tax=Tenacibaculum insulae TaxID=2029677 RepID=UPI003AB77064